MAEPAPDDALLVEMGLTEKEYLAALKRIEQQTVRTSKKNENAFKAANRNTTRGFQEADRGARNFSGGGLRQVSLQLSQVAQQGAATGDYLRALAIQLPDLAIGLGAAGVAAGALAGALAPMALDMFMAGDATEELEEAMDNLTSAVKRVQDAQAALSMSPLDLRVEHGELDEAARRLQEIEAQIASMRAKRELDAATSAVAEGMGLGPVFTQDPRAVADSIEAVQRLREERERLDNSVSQMSDREFAAANARVREISDEISALRDVEGGVNSLAKSLGVTEEEARSVAVQFAALGEMDDMQERSRAMVALADHILKTSDNLSTADSDAGKLYDALMSAAEAAMQLAKINPQTGLEDAASAAERAQAQILKDYAKTTRQLEKLARDREVAEQGLAEAMQEGAEDAAAAFREAIATIDAEVSDLIGAEQSIKDMTDQLDALIRGLDLVEFDGEEQVREAIEAMRERLESANGEVDTLNEADLDQLKSGFSGLLSFLDRFLSKIGLASKGLADLKVPTAGEFEARYVSRAVSGAGSADEELVRAVVSVADQLGIAAKDLLTVMSYETGGTFSTSIANPTTGATGLIGFMPENQRRYGVGAGSTITEQVIAAGQYLQDAGVKAGDGLLRIYAAINAGSPDRIHASDAGNGGAPGTVLDKVTGQMSGHEARASGLLAAYGGAVQAETEAITKREQALKREIEARKEALRVREDLVAAAQRATDDAEIEAQMAGKSAAEQARLRTEYMLMQQAKRDGISLNDQMAGSEQTYAEHIRDTAAAVGEYVAQKERQEQADERAADRTQFYADVQQNLKSGLIDSIVEGKNFAEVLDNVAKMLAKAALQAALFGDGPLAAGGGGGGLFGALFSGLSSMFGGARASGGTVSAGRSYMVGENGPEPFIPAVNGRILSTQQAQAALRGTAGGAAVVNMKTEIVTPPGGSVRQEQETLSDGTRLQRYIVSEAVNDAITTPGGAANRTLQARGVRAPRPRR